MIKFNEHKTFIEKSVIVAVIASIAVIVYNNLSFFTTAFTTLISLSEFLFYGIAIAYALSPLANFLERKYKLGRGSSTLVTYTIVILFFYIALSFVLPVLATSIEDMVSNIPTYISQTQNFVNDVIEHELVKGLSETESVRSLVDTANQTLTNSLNGIGQYLLNLIINISSTTVSFALGLLVSAYVLIDRNRLLRNLHQIILLLFKAEKAGHIVDFAKTYSGMIGKYIGIKAVDSTIIGSISFVLLTLVESEYTLLLAITVGFTNMVPYFGPFVGEIIGFLINVFVSPIKGVAVFLVLLLLQQFDGWYLDPKMVGNRVGVRPMWIIYAVVVGGGFFGVLGMLLASPTAATIKLYYEKLVKKNSHLFNEAGDPL